MMTYEQARADHEYLWSTYAPADDMTGAYVDQDDLDRLLKSPTKAMARKCYMAQIHYWFDAGPDTALPLDDWRNDPEVAVIAERHGCEDGLAW